MHRWPVTAGNARWPMPTSKQASRPMEVDLVLYHRFANVSHMYKKIRWILKARSLKCRKSDSYRHPCTSYMMKPFTGLLNKINVNACVCLTACPKLGNHGERENTAQMHRLWIKGESGLSLHLLNHPLFSTWPCAVRRQSPPTASWVEKRHIADPTAKMSTIANTNHLFGNISKKNPNVSFVLLVREWIWLYKLHVLATVIFSYFIFYSVLYSFWDPLPDDLRSHWASGLDSAGVWGPGGWHQGSQMTVSLQHQNFAESGDDFYSLYKSKKV